MRTYFVECRRHSSIKALLRRAKTKQFEAQTLVAELAVEALRDAVCQGLPGLINAAPMPW